MNTILTRLSTELIRTYEAEGFWRSDTIYALVRGHAERAPDSFAVRDRFRRLTYRQLLAATDALAADLAGYGVRAGQRVGIWLPSRIESVVALLACSKSGAICCPSLHRDHTVGEVVELMQRVRCMAFIWQDGYGADADRHDVDRSAEGGADTAACLSAGRRLRRRDKAPIAGTDARPRPRTLRSKTDPNQIVYLAFTSGTTGKPKGVMHSDNTLLANARQLAKDWSISDRRRWSIRSPRSATISASARPVDGAGGGRRARHQRSAARRKPRRPHPGNRHQLSGRRAAERHRSAWPRCSGAGSRASAG